MNQWAGDQTEGLIQELVRTFDPETVVTIANAVHFQDRWSWEFKPEETREEVFYAPDRKTTAQFMLREGKKQYYYEDERVQAIELGFLNAGSMYVILPKDGDAAKLLASLDKAYFEQIIQGTEDKTGKLLLPKFKIAGEPLKLDQALQAFGIPLFDQKAAALTGVVQG